MPAENVPLIAFNRGIIDRRALARVDIKRTALSAEVQTNWMPRVLGSMSLRPGFEHLGATADNNRAFHLPFVFRAITDMAIIELTDEKMRVRIDDDVLTRPDVDTVVTNGDFSDATGWTDADESGAASTITGGKLELVGTRFSSAIRKREVTVAAGDQNVEHALRIVVDRGPVTFRCGSSDGAEDYVTETTLGTGEHSLAFTPSGNFWVQLGNSREAVSIVDSITVEAAGAMELTAPWAEDDLRLVRYDQSFDVVYCACSGYQQRKIERRGTGRSWSIVLYEPEDGPYRNANLDAITITPSAISGDVTLTASRAVFKSTSVGGLYRLTSVGQRVEATLTGEDQWSDPIKVTGTGTARTFRIVVTQAGVTNQATLQRSVGEPGAWIDVTGYSSTGGTNYTDGLDDQIIYYRIGVATGNYSADSTDVSLTYSSGGLTGVARITGYTSQTSVSAAVLTALGGTTGSSDWAEGLWSPRRGYPSAVAFHQGRLAWGGKGRVVLSASDAYESFDPDTEGDGGPINRTIAGSADDINFLLRLKRLAIGADSAEFTAQSSSLDEPLTPTNFNLDDPSTQGSAAVAAIKTDKRGLFVQRSGTKLYQLMPTGDVYGEYESVDLNELTPSLCDAGILRIVVQRQPDTRVHCLLGDGTVAVLISQPAEEVLCWVLVESPAADGYIEDVLVMPGRVEDSVYYQVRRTIDGATVRYFEKWALESECHGGTLNKQADSFFIYDDVETDTITGLDHLEGEDVVVWGDGKDLGTYTVASGSITLSAAVSEACIGLKYYAEFKSAKLAYAAAGGTALTMTKKVHGLGLILADTHYQGLRYGKSLNKVNGEYTDLYNLPAVENEKVTPAHTVWEEYDTDRFMFDGEWDTDSRMCLVAAAPRPCTVLAAITGIKTNG